MGLSVHRDQGHSRGDARAFENPAESGPGRPGPEGTPRAAQAEGVRTPAEEVLGRQGWCSSSEREALASVLCPEALPQFPHSPQDARAFGRESGGGWRVASLGRWVPPTPA